MPDALTFQNGNVVVLSALACGGVALAIAAGLWALAEQHAARRLRKSLRSINARSKAALGERDALLGTAKEALVVWGRDGSGPFSYGGGEELLQSCRKGADGPALSAAIDGLSDRGVGFSLEVQDIHGRKFLARGRAVGSMAAVWLGELHAAAERGSEFKAVLDALPIPVWLRDNSLALNWGNQAFLKAIGVADLESARRDQVALDKGERDLAQAARAVGAPQQSRRFSVVGGQRRALNITQVPLGETGVVGTALDVSDMVAAEARLQ
ncbi:MAG: hypothetical protein JO212_05935 [Acetobacteraceae bacterium]|nr:hypothetical protein [Acetobacteraceae bacterium]